MNQQFYNQFIPTDKNIIAIFGDRLRSSLLHLLSGESARNGKKALIIADSPIPYPLEGKVLVCDELSIVKRLIDNEDPEQIYLASKVKDDFLYPFLLKEIKPFIKSLDRNDLLFFDISSKGKINFKTHRYLDDALLICSINYNLLKDNLPQISKIKDLKSKSIDEQISDKVHNLIKKMCPHFTEVEEVEDKICFIDQVKGLYDENVIRSIARNLETKLNCKMLIGNTNSFHVKAI